ncbi:MAG TPA: sulfite oxidase, partial [Microlunatus sp.]
MLEGVSEAARIAEVGEAITAEELALAARNHGMPLEAMRYDVTPAGLHYLLTHYDIPVVDPTTWRLSVSGEVCEPISAFTLDLPADSL